MKGENKMRKSKFIVLALALVLLITSAFALTAMAEDATTPTLEIVSKNLSYEDNIRILFAVKSENVGDATVKLNVYEADPTDDAALEPEETVSPSYTESINNYGECGVYFTTGIAAKYLQKQIYVQAEVTVNDVTYKSEVERYSIVEYCHEMIAKESTPAEKDEIYATVIEYGAAIQKLLSADKDKDGNPKYDGALATAYNYVTIEGGTLDGRYNTGIYLDKAEITPVGEGVDGWTVITYANDGTSTTDGVKLGNSFQVGGRTEITAGMPATYKAGTETFESCTVGGTMPGWMSSNPDYTKAITSDTVYDKTSNVFKATTNAGGKNLTISKTYSDSYTANGTGASAGEATAFEISFDLKFDAPSGSTSIGSYHIMFDNASGNAVYYLQIMGDAGYRIGIKNNQSDSTGSVWLPNTFLANEWHNYRFKIYVPDGGSELVVSIYVDGAESAAVTYKAQKNAGHTAASQISQFRFQSTSNTVGGSIYMDNVYCGYTKE